MHNIAHEPSPDSGDALGLPLRHPVMLQESVPASPDDDTTREVRINPDPTPADLRRARRAAVLDMVRGLAPDDVAGLVDDIRRLTPAFNLAIDPPRPDRSPFLDIAAKLEEAAGAVDEARLAVMQHRNELDARFREIFTHCTEAWLSMTVDVLASDQKRMEAAARGE